MNSCQSFMCFLLVGLINNCLFNHGFHLFRNGYKAISNQKIPANISYKFMEKNASLVTKTGKNKKININPINSFQLRPLPILNFSDNHIFKSFYGDSNG